VRAKKWWNVNRERALPFCRDTAPSGDSIDVNKRHNRPPDCCSAPAAAGDNIGDLRQRLLHNRGFCVAGQVYCGPIRFTVCSVMERGGKPTVNLDHPSK